MEISKTVQTLEGIIFTTMVPYGEHIQNEVLLKQRQYDWLVGHLTDIGIAGGVVAWVLMPVKDKKEALKYSLIIQTAISAFDLFTSLHPRITYDWQDTACYYGAALLAYGIKRISEK